MGRICVCCYYKCVVVKLDPFCESSVVLDKNCAQCELSKLKSEVKQNYPSKNGYVSIFRKQNMYLEN
jgi:hypothetical protein